MKKKKIIILSAVIVAVLAIVLTLTLCLTLINNAQTLDAPSNVRADGNTIKWDEVKHASEYEININEMSFDVKQCSYNFDEFNYLSGDYTIKVKAKGDGKEYLDSDWSNEIVLSYTNSATYTLDIIASDGGTTSIINSSPSYAANSLVQVVAYPNSGWYFDGWYSTNFFKLSSDTTFSFTINTNTILRAQFAPNSTAIDQTYVQETELMGNSPNFAIYVHCPEGEQYIRKNLFIYDDYFMTEAEDGSLQVADGYEKEAKFEIGRIEYRGNNFYAIYTLLDYQASGAYIARATGSVTILKEATRFANGAQTSVDGESDFTYGDEEGLSELAFSIGNTEHSKVVLKDEVRIFSFDDNPTFASNPSDRNKYTDGVVFERIGTGCTENGEIGGFITDKIDFVRNGKPMKLDVGSLVGFGGGISLNMPMVYEESDGTTYSYNGLRTEQFNERTVLGIVKEIHYLGYEDTKYPVYFVELLPIEDEGDFFEVLDIYVEDDLQLEGYVDPDDEALIESIQKSFYQNEEFQKFLAGISATVDEYANDEDVEIAMISASSFLDKIKIKPNLTIKDKKLTLTIKGEINLDFNKTKPSVGKISGNLGISFELTEQLQYTVKFSWIKGRLGIKKGFDIRLIQDEETKFTFDVKVTFSAETGDYGDFILNKSTKCIHVPKCWHIDQMLETNKQPSKKSLSKLEEEGYWPCGTCLADEKNAYLDKIETEEFREKLARTLKYSDWGNKLKEIKEALSGKSGNTTTDSADKQIMLADIPFNCIIDIDIRVYLHMSFKLEATLHYEHIAKSQSTMGARIAIDEFRFYSNKTTTSKSSELTLVGKVGAEIGVRLEVTAGLRGVLELGLYGEFGLYADLSGIVHVYEKNDYENNKDTVAAYAAAYFEMGVYVDVGVSYNAFRILKGSKSLYKQKFPFLQMGHDKAIYGYVYDHEEVLMPVTETKKEFSLKELGLLEVKNIKLPSMVQGTETLDLNNEFLIVNAMLEGGPWLELDLVTYSIRVKEGMPYGTKFEGTLYLSIVGKNRSWTKYNKDSAAIYLPTIEVKIVGENKCTEHKMIYISTIPATCTETGLEECYICTKCHKFFNMDNEVIEARQVLPALNHSYKTYEAVAPTCYLPGITSYTVCERCDEYGIEPKTVEPLGHDLNSDKWRTTQTPTCINQGLEGNECNRCGIIFEYRVILPTGHLGVDKDHDEPTCDVGVYCKDCNRQLASPLTHEYSLTVSTKAPTCTEDGYIIEKCKYCGKDRRKTVAALGHSGMKLGEVVSSVFYCDKEGEVIYICATCHEEASEPQAPIGHEYSHTYTVDESATCTTSGKASYHCTRDGCDSRIDDFVIPPKGHTPSAEDPRKCAVCGLGIDINHTDDHETVEQGAKKATCQSTGLTNGLWCNVCEAWIEEPEETPIDRDNHIIEHKTGQGPTCYVDGWTDYDRCTRQGCDYISGRTVLPAQHTLEHYEEEFNCELPGKIEYWECTGICKKLFSDANCQNEISEDALLKNATSSHKWGDTVAAEKCSGGVAGHNAYTQCTKCKKVYKLIRGENDKNDEQIINEENLHNTASRIYHKLKLEITAGDCTNWAKLIYICEGGDDCNKEEAEIKDNNDNVTKIKASAVIELNNTLLDTFASEAELRNKFGGESALIDGNSIIYFNHYLPKYARYANCLSCYATLGFDYRLNNYLLDGKECYSLSEVKKSTIAWGISNPIIPDTYMGMRVTEISSSAFAGLSNISAVALPNYLTTIGSGAFEKCKELKLIVIPSSVTNIGGGAFNECSILKNIFIRSNRGEGTGLEYDFGTVGEGDKKACKVYAKSEKCMGEEFVYLPEKLSEEKAQIGVGAFTSCPYIKVIVFNGTVAQWKSNAFASWSGGFEVQCSDGIMYGDGYVDYGFELEDAGNGYKIVGLKQNADKNYVFGYNNSYKKDWSKITELVFPEYGRIDGVIKPIVEIGANFAQNYPTNIESIIVSATVKTISSSAFNGCSKLTSVTFAENSQLLTVGDYAFAGCTKLTGISLPNTVTHIDERAFSNCSGFTELEIPKSVTYIGVYAFENCSLIEELKVPQSVTTICAGAFSGFSSLTEIVLPFVGEQNYGTKYKNARKVPKESLFGYIFGENSDNGGQKTAQQYDSQKSGDNTVAIIAEYYIPKSLREVTIMSGAINAYAFDNCSLLTKIILEKGVNRLEDYAFRNCTSLTRIGIYGSVSTSMSGKFKNCSSLNGVEITDMEKWLQCDWYGTWGIAVLRAEDAPTFIAHHLYLKDTLVTDIVIPDGVQVVCFAAFSGLTDVKSVYIPSSVKTLDNYAFANCSALSDIYYEGTADEWNKIYKNGNWDGSNKYTVYCSDGVIENKPLLLGPSVTPYSFTFTENESGYALTGYNNKGAKTVEIPSSYEGKPVTEIGASVFSDFNLLESVTIPSTITKIGANAFSNCSRLKSITIPDSVTSIGNGAFSGCSGLTSITIPDGVTNIGDCAFYGCSGLTNITVSSGNTKFQSVNNCIIETTSKTLIFGCNTSIIPTDGSVTSIGNYAFYGCSGLISVTIPDSVTSIGNYAFYGCSGLISVTIPDSVTSIGSSAFSECSGLTSVSIPDGVTNIGDNAFSGCSELTSIVIPDNVTSIGESVFYGCSKLENITIPISVTNIDNNAFSNCGKLAVITFDGTKAQWNDITKHTNWNTNTQKYTIRCTDGDIVMNYNSEVAGNGVDINVSNDNRVP